ncbi:MAG: hypothetical protein K9J83_04625 [Desulfarculaceae bacterium]|nr:hypothetical protein [Desulfarculaceae bacterium]
MKKWKCTICNYIHEGDAPPERCPICNAPASKFILLEDGTEGKEEKETIRPEREKETEPGKPETALDKLMDTLVRHHAHPVSVHIPNGMLPVTVLIILLAWFFDSTLLSKTAFVNIIFVTLSLPLVLFTGVVEWTKKYNKAMTALFKIKITAAAVTSASCLIVLLWFIADPGVLDSPKSIIFILLNLIMIGAAGLAGFLGGKLVFKD